MNRATIKRADANLIQRLLREEAGALYEDANVDKRHGDEESAATQRATANRAQQLAEMFDIVDEIEIES